MHRLATVFLLVHTFVLAGLAGLAGAATPPAVDPKISDAKADEAKAVPGGLNDPALWWNEPRIVKVLSLTDEQRKKMGEQLKVYRGKVPRERRPEAFHETLVQGNWKEARSESEKVSKTAEASVRLRGKLKIDVLSVLSDEQREKLVDRYPRLIYKPWMRAMRGAPPS